MQVHTCLSLQLFFLLCGCGGEYFLLLSPWRLSLHVSSFLYTSLLTNPAPWVIKCGLDTSLCLHSVWSQCILTTLCFSPYVLKHKTTRNDIIRERRNPLVAIMCSLGAWYFLFRGQMLSLLFTPHDHSWRVQLCLESLPRSGTEESDC